MSNYHMNPYSGDIPSRNPGFSPYGHGRSPMGPPDGPRHGYFPQQHETSPMGGPGMMGGQRFPTRNSSPFSPPSYQSPYHQSPGSSPHDSGGRRGGSGGGGYQRRDSRGWGRGRGGRGGDYSYTPSGHQQFHNRRRIPGGSPYQRGQYGDNSTDIQRYFKQSMLEDPWKDLERAAASAS
ncbi:uncharacterized protein [Diadema antillarum]